VIKLKDLITEVAWTNKTLNMAALRRIPISAPIMKKVLGDITVGSFHMTDATGVDKIKSLVGKKKSLSTFTHTTKGGQLAGGGGIKTQGGILFSLEGKLMTSSFQDIMSAPDESGRRWLHSGNFEGMFGLGDFDIEGHLGKNKTWKEKYSGSGLSLGQLTAMTGKDQAEYIKIYIDEVTKLMVKNKAKIKKAFGQKITKQPKGTIPHWNELIVSQIKLKDALLLTGTPWLNDMMNFDPEDFEKLEKKIKNIITGNLIISDGWAKNKSAFQKFVKSRGGIVS